MGVNHKPVITGTDNGIWRRVHLIPFEVTIPKEQQDEQLHEKMMSEAPGVFNWILSGCLDWKRTGLQVPDVVKIATEGYRHDMDRIAGFLEERCNIGNSFKVPSGELYRAYNQWCEQENTRPLDSKKFKIQMMEKGFRTGHTRTGKTYFGITLSTESSF
jgi:putative DNA primase/helicase